MVMVKENILFFTCVFPAGTIEELRIPQGKKFLADDHIKVSCTRERLNVQLSFETCNQNFAIPVFSDSRMLFHVVFSFIGKFILSWDTVIFLGINIMVKTDLQF